MTRPQIIRADTIDLQDHDAPSAKDHKLPPSTDQPLPTGSLAPHQAETIREVHEERAGEEARSPRVSWVNGELQQHVGDLAADITRSLNGNKMPQEDALAIAQNGGAANNAAADEESDFEIDTGDDDMDDDMMDRISSSPSIEDEDIDFEFVYALHTFVATVEGQANATKGDTMVLLDDTNTYWWLVRIVKDSSIGYLPAEHIETPTERLARLNKHRNVDLSATMLGDKEDKAINPIMAAMKRHKKKVVFTDPTYVDYSDIDYSTEEEDGGGDAQTQQQAEQQDQKQQSTQQADDMEEDETAKVQPLKPRGQKQAKDEAVKAEEADEITPLAQDDQRRSSDDMFDAKVERTTRNGTVRNTDSFFKDETIETKKITLTPGLLRDDNEPRGSNSLDSKEVRQRPSFEKDLSPDKKDDKKKKEKDKKEKEKKPSAIRSFFSRKERKKSIDDDDESFGKRSIDSGTGAAEGDMVDEPRSMDMDSSPESAASPQRHGGKLQKSQPGHKLAIATQPLTIDRTLASEVRTNNVANVPPATLRMVESEQLSSPEKSSPKEEKPKSAISKILPSSEGRPPKVTKAKSRVELDDFDSPEEDEVAPPEPSRSPPEPRRQPSEEKLVRPSLPGAFPDSYTSTRTAVPQQGESAYSQPPTGERLLESPVQASPIASSNPPALTADTSSQEDRSSPVSSPSPELAGADSRATHRNQDSTTTSTSTTTSSSWNDANLRAFFDSSTDIRDLLVVVYDKTDVPPAGPEHPVVGSLFREQNAKLAEITTQLDNMLGDWLARKQRLRGTV